jgi:uncharacterized membrane protein YdbT with pleckstrin-like domain
MDDNKLGNDEARRAAGHEAVKSQVGGEVNAEVEAEADRVAPAERQQIGQVAHKLRSEAIHEVESDDREVHRARKAARGSQVIDYVFYLIYVLLGLRLALALMAARSEAGFVVFIRTVTAPLYAPFRGIVSSPELEGGGTFVMPIVIAIVVYILLHAAINGVLRMVASRKTEI